MPITAPTTPFKNMLATAGFGSQADFNRLDMTNSSYYQVGKRRWVIARSTRFGTEQSWGNSSEVQVPLPERPLRRRRAVASWIRHQPGRPARPGDRLSHRRRRRVCELNRICGCPIRRCPTWATTSALFFSTTWATPLTTSPISGAAFCGFASLISLPAKTLRRLHPKARF